MCAADEVVVEVEGSDVHPGKRPSQMVPIEANRDEQRLPRIALLNASLARNSLMFEQDEAFTP